MKKLSNVLWWAFFVFLSVVIQAFVPGLDALVVGRVILLQARDYKNLLWLLPLFILLQEGMGTRVFGTAIIFYTATFLLFRMGRWLFEVENFVFIFLLSSCIGVAYFGVYWLMAHLHDIVFSYKTTIDLCLVQALYVPFAWRFFTALRPKVTNAEEK